jgi:hypothetical protein
MAVGHDTADSVLNSRLGVVWSDQFDPFQAWTVVAPIDSPPTAVQDVGVGHETPVSGATRPGGSTGVVWLDQLVPSQAAASGNPCVAPTAVQAMGEMQETAFSWPEEAMAPVS